jgi:hypothetical protein
MDPDLHYIDFCRIDLFEPFQQFLFAVQQRYNFLPYLFRQTGD